MCLRNHIQALLTYWSVYHFGSAFSYQDFISDFVWSALSSSYLLHWVYIYLSYFDLQHNSLLLKWSVILKPYQGHLTSLNYSRTIKTRCLIHHLQLSQPSKFWICVIFIRFLLKIKIYHHSFAFKEWVELGRVFGFEVFSFCLLHFWPSLKLALHILLLDQDLLDTWSC